MLDLSPLDTYEVASLGVEASTVRRALKNLFEERKETLLRHLSGMTPDGMEYAKIAGRIQEWVDIERTFELREAEGRDAVAELKGKH